MRRYLSGGWAVLKSYLFAMVFFYIFFIGMASRASLYSIAIFIVMISLLYFELTHHTGVDKRRYGKVRPIDGAIYGLLAIAPFVIIQIILSQLDYSFLGPNFDISILKQNLVKGFVAPMLFIAKLVGGYSSVWSYISAWATIVVVAFLGYYSGYKNFDLGAFMRKLFGLQPRKKSTNRWRR